MTGLVRLAVFIGCTAMIGVNAQTTSTELNTTSNDDYTIEWITPKRPPMPPVKKDGKWVPWEEVYGSLPELPPRPIKRYKNPRPVDPQAQWVGIKRRLAPWMTDAELRATNAPTTPALEAAKRRATIKQGFVPKVNPVELREATKRRAEKQRQAAEDAQNPPYRGSGGGDDEEDEEEIKLHLVDVHFDEGFSRYILWVTDAPTDEPFEIYFADEMNPNRWRLAYVGYPQNTYGSISEYVIFVNGTPQQGFFRAFPLQDSDGDGISDGMEIAFFHSNPTDPDSGFTRDADGDGLPDFPGRAGNWIVDGDEDFDGDGYSNLKELWMGTDPLVPQDNLADSDNDGLPDWAESLIWIYQGNPNPDLRDDSDGDGVDNYTEIAALTDPSWPDAVYAYWNFYNLPDVRRAISFAPITVQHTTSTNAASTNRLIYNNAGTLGTYLHLDVRRDQDADGEPLPGYDTIYFGGGFLSPPSGMFLDMLADGVEHSDGYIPWKDLLITSTSLLADIWEEAKVSDAIDAFNIETLAVIKQRAMLRTVVRLRELQLAVDVTDVSTGSQMRLRTAISEIHTEVTLFRETSIKIASYQGQSWATRAGYWVSVGGRVASFFSIWGSAEGVLDSAIPYIRDVRRRCDNNSDSAADLAVALGNLAAEFANGFSLGNFWLIYWNQLSEFDGYDSQCW